jgi:O-antigen ligase
MGLYVVVNLGSMLAPHRYAAGAPLDPTSFSVSRFVLIGIVMPLAMFLIGRIVFDHERAVRHLLWCLIAAGAYSAFASITQFHGPTWLIWPRYILDNPNWEGRALGVFNQPVVNGLVLIVGFLAATLIASHASQPLAHRILGASVAVPSVYAIYLTHTRAVWLSFALVVILGVLGAVGFRTGYVLSLAGVLTTVTINWSGFTSADRAAGGVASAGELQDRLNAIATSVWAIQREPLTGWGIGRFPAVNTYHHQGWSPGTPWERGYGVSSHFDMLGILVELGIVGLVLWLAVLALVGGELVRAIRRLPANGLDNRPFAITAAMSLVALLVTGLTVDLRFFDFPNVVVWLLVGAAIGRARNVELRAASHSGASTTQPPAPSGQVQNEP